MNKNWYALAVQPRKERYVKQQLEREGLNVVLPIYRKNVRHARASKVKLKPLFPGYLFVHIEPTPLMWRRVNWVHGSIGLVRFGDRPSPLPQSFVEGFIDESTSDGVVNFNHNLEIGDSVIAIGGPFDRLRGEIVELSDTERVKILIEALSRKIQTTLPRTAVVSAA